MVENSKIEWTDHTFNPWIGCQEVSAACDHCYARVQNEFRHWVNGWGPHGERKRTSKSNWTKPLAWNKTAARLGRRYRVFCASLADVFDNKVPKEWRDDLWEMIRATPHLDWLLLTKRPENIAGMLPEDWGKGYPNVWLGCTVENAAERRRLPHLLNIDAAIHFISAEPLLSMLDLSKIPYPNKFYGGGKCSSCKGDVSLNAYTGDTHCESGCDGPTIAALDWIIVGGESGAASKRRTFPLPYARNIRDACEAYGVAFFGKQLNKVDPLPADLMIRQFPENR